MELARANIDSIDFVGTTTKQKLHEAAGGSTSIERHGTMGAERERRQCSSQLLGTTRNKIRCVFGKREPAPTWYVGSRLAGDLPIEQDIATFDQVART